MKNLPRNLLHFFQHLPSTPTYPGNIEVFKDMELTSLNLYYCRELTGMFGLGWGVVGGVKIGNRLRPQGLALIGTTPKEPSEEPSPLGQIFPKHHCSYTYTVNTSSPYAGKDKAKKMFPNATVSV